MTPSPAITVRTAFRPGDLGGIVRLHGTVYAAECGFDVTFEAYVAGPLAHAVLNPSPRQRIWLAERGEELVGCMAVVPADDDAAQLRWFLVHPSARGRGLGRSLLAAVIGFARTAGYRRMTLWTVASLATAAQLYRAAGFALAEERPGRMWGVDVVEQRYEMGL